MVTHYKNERGSADVWLILGILVLAVGGIIYYVIQRNQTTQVSNTTGTQTAGNEQVLPNNLNELMTIDQAKQKASDDKPGATITKVGLTQSTQGTVFHIEFADGSNLDLDAKTGNKVTGHDVADSTDGADLPKNFTPTINVTKAEQIAKTQITQGTIIRIDLQTEENKPVYVVRFSTGAKVLVNAMDGTVVKIQAENAQGKQPTSTPNSGSSSGSSGSSSSGSGSSEHSGSSTSGDSGSGTSSGSGSGSGSDSDNSGSGSDDSSSGRH